MLENEKKEADRPLTIAMVATGATALRIPPCNGRRSWNVKGIMCVWSASGRLISRLV